MQDSHSRMSQQYLHMSIEQGAAQPALCWCRSMSTSSPCPPTCERVGAQTRSQLSAQCAVSSASAVSATVESAALVYTCYSVCPWDRDGGRAEGGYIRRRLRLRDLLRVNPTSSLQIILATSIPIISWYMYINDVLLIVHARVRIDR
jgi:hypothetical protein